MKLTNVAADNAPKAIGPYVHALRAGDFIYCSGQIGIDPKTGLLVPGIKKQTIQCLENLSAVLNAAGSDVSHVVKTTLYITNMDEFDTVNKIYGSYFHTHKPARSTVEVSRLPIGALIEIDAVAVV